MNRHSKLARHATLRALALALGLLALPGTAGIGSAPVVRSFDCELESTTSGAVAHHRSGPWAGIIQTPKPGTETSRG
jgi:hypothetical protein